MASSSSPKGYYQICGFRASVVWFQYDDKRLAEALFSEASPLRAPGASPGSPIELVLGTKRTGTTHILLPSSLAHIFATRFRLERLHSPIPLDAFESVSPIHFASMEELHRKLGLYKNKSRNRGGRPEDLSQANRAYSTESLEGVEKGMVEHGRLLWHIFHHAIHPAHYGLGFPPFASYSSFHTPPTPTLPPSPSFSALSSPTFNARWSPNPHSAQLEGRRLFHQQQAGDAKAAVVIARHPYQHIRVFSFAHNVAALDSRRPSEALRNPKLVDVGWAEATVPGTPARAGASGGSGGEGQGEGEGGEDRDEWIVDMIRKHGSTRYIRSQTNAKLRARGAPVAFRYSDDPVNNPVEGQLMHEKQLQDVVKEWVRSWAAPINIETPSQAAPPPPDTQKPTIVLLVHNKEAALAVFKKYGINTDGWKTGLRELLYPPRAGGGGGSTGPDDYDSRRRRNRSRSRSPSHIGRPGYPRDRDHDRKRDPVKRESMPPPPSSSSSSSDPRPQPEQKQQAAKSQFDDFQEALLASRIQVDVPVHVVDVQQLYIKLRQATFRSETIVGVARDLIGEVGRDGGRIADGSYCAGNEAVYLIDVFRHMISRDGPPSEWPSGLVEAAHERDRLRSTTLHSVSPTKIKQEDPDQDQDLDMNMDTDMGRDATPPPASAQLPPSEDGEVADDGEDDFDPNDIVQLPGTTKSVASVGLGGLKPIANTHSRAHNGFSAPPPPPFSAPASMGGWSSSQASSWASWAPPPPASATATMSMMSSRGTTPALSMASGSSSGRGGAMAAANVNVNPRAGWTMYADDGDSDDGFSDDD